TAPAARRSTATSSSCRPRTSSARGRSRPRTSRRWLPLQAPVVPQFNRELPADHGSLRNVIVDLDLALVLRGSHSPQRQNIAPDGPQAIVGHPQPSTAVLTEMRAGGLGLLEAGFT